MAIFSLLVASMSGFLHESKITYQRHEIDYYDGRILVDYRVKIDISARTLRATLTDYEKFNELSPLIVKSKRTTENGKEKISQTLRPCVLGVCYSLEKNQIILLDNNGKITAKVIPEQSHFDSGFEQWFVESTNEGTFLNYHSDLTPKFVVPPIIGPMLLRKVIHQELNEIATRLVAEESQTTDHTAKTL